MLPALLLGLLPAAAGAQEQPLPSVSDYHLPTPSPRATRASGPVDPGNPVVPVRRNDSAEAPAAPASPSASASPARAARPSPKPSPSASASPSASPSRAAEPRRAEEAPARKRPDEAERADTREPAAAEPESSPSPAETPSASATAAAPPVQWNVHSARDAQGNPIWPWLLGIAVLLGANALLLFLLLRRRQRLAEEFRAEEARTEEVRAEEVRAGELRAAQPAAHDEAEPADEPLQLAVPEQVDEAPAPQVPAQPMSAPPSRPALELVAKPIEVTLAVRQLSATLMNAVLHYELVVTNLSDEAVGPVIIAGDMIGAHASLPARAQLEITGNDIEPHHRHPILHAREWAKFSGEFRLPLAAITPIRSGRASLFVPLARFRVEVLRNGAPPLVINRAFVIGETPENPAAALKPFRLDLGPRLYSHIGQREVAATA